MAMSDYLESKIRDHVLRNISYTSPTTVYMALYTVAPTDAGGGTEVTGGSYARQAVAFTAGGTAGEASNTAAEAFANMPACTVVAAGIFDALSGGNLLLHDALSVPKVVTAGEALDFAVGDIDAAFT